jgi:hypothetical protein
MVNANSEDSEDYPESDGGSDQQTLENVFQLKKSNAAFYAILDVLPIWLINDSGHLGEFKQSLRFDVNHSLRRSVH